MGRVSKDKRESSARHFFVGSKIDDAGLTPAEFRVLGRIVRRGKCTESISNIAEGTKIGIHQCRRAIKALEKKKWIRRTEVIGRGVILETTINEALPLTDKLGVTPHQSVRRPLTDKLTEPLTDKSDKGTTNKELLERIYNEYPRKTVKGKALKAIERALEKESFEFLLERTKAYAKARKGQPTKFTPYPATWFKDEQYTDDPESWCQDDYKNKAKGFNTNSKLNQERDHSEYAKHVT